MNNLFSVPIKAFNLSHLDLNSIKDFCLSRRDEGLQHSNEGGYHSKYFDLTSKELLPLCNDILDIGKNFCDELEVEQVTHIQNMWSIVNKFGHYNKEHIHPNSFFSGVFYPGDEYPDDCGDLCLVNPAKNLMSFDWDHTQKNYNVYNSLVMNIKPVRGRMIIFPSYLSHFVHMNQNKNVDRLVISFNLK